MSTLMARHLSGGGDYVGIYCLHYRRWNEKWASKLETNQHFCPPRTSSAPWKWADLQFHGPVRPQLAGQHSQIQFRHVSVAGCGSKIRQRGPFCASDSFGHNLCVTSSIFFSIAAASIRSPAVRATPRCAAALPAECHRRRGRGHDVRWRLVRGDDAVRHQLLGYGGAAGPVGAPGHAAPAAQGRAAAPGGVSLRRPHEILDQQPEAGVRRAALIQTPAQYWLIRKCLTKEKKIVNQNAQFRKVKI